MEVTMERTDCTWCGAENSGVMGQIVRDEQALGKISEDVIGRIAEKVYVIVDMRRPPLVGARIPAAKAYADVCGVCGREFSFRIEKGHATLPMQPGAAPIFQ